MVTRCKAVSASQRQRGQWLLFCQLLSQAGRTSKLCSGWWATHGICISPAPRLSRTRSWDLCLAPASTVHGRPRRMCSAHYLWISKQSGPVLRCLSSHSEPLPTSGLTGQQGWLWNMSLHRGSGHAPRCHLLFLGVGTFLCSWRSHRQEAWGLLVCAHQSMQNAWCYGTSFKHVKGSAFSCVCT